MSYKYAAWMGIKGRLFEKGIVTTCPLHIGEKFCFDLPGTFITCRIKEIETWDSKNKIEIPMIELKPLRPNRRRDYGKDWGEKTTKQLAALLVANGWEQTN